ncbi:MAG: ABC transporter substrate-binding protein [Alphaproteobacteria bacterium]|nr:ABC transporter substrate-binding protein [Alphaproteobacteria bacterium]
MRIFIAAVTGSVLSLMTAGMAGAEDTVKIGAIYPLSGVSASAGQYAKAAIETAEDIINTPHPGLESLPLGAGQGLPRLNGGKIEAVFADQQGNPSVGQSQTLRLITQDHVVAMNGAYQSSVSFAATAVAERYGIPFVVGDSAAPNITERGFQWTFRTTPIGTDFAKIYTAFLTELKQSGQKLGTIAFVYENTDYGTSVSSVIRDSVKKAGFDVVADISYAANSTDVSPQVLQLKDKNPDVVVFISYTADAILYVKTMKNLGYRPPLVVADDSGFSDPAFVTAVGNLAQDVVNRSAWAVGKPNSPTWLINELYKTKSGQNLDDTSGRIMQGFFVLADAINRAGSTEPAAIQKALRETDLKPEQLMMGYRGVKFDEHGQNILASSYVIQLQGAEYKSVWPDNTANAKLELPYKGWE